MKQETLEEAAEMYARTHTDTSVFRTTHIRDFIEGAKWQQERSYSEEEVEDAYDKGFKDASERSYSEEDMRKAIQETITLMRYKATEFRLHENTVIEKFKKK